MNKTKTDTLLLALDLPSEDVMTRAQKKYWKAIKTHYKSLNAIDRKEFMARSRELLTTRRAQIMEALKDKISENEVKALDGITKTLLDKPIV